MVLFKEIDELLKKLPPVSTKMVFPRGRIITVLSPCPTSKKVIVGFVIKNFAFMFIIKIVIYKNNNY